MFKGYDLAHKSTLALDIIHIIVEAIESIPKVVQPELRRFTRTRTPSLKSREFMNDAFAFSTQLDEPFTIQEVLMSPQALTNANKP
jgi:hypothetical protein